MPLYYIYDIYLFLYGEILPSKYLVIRQQSLPTATKAVLFQPHLDVASGCQGVHEDMAPGILHQHVRDEPDGGGVYLLQPDTANTTPRNQKQPPPLIDSPDTAAGRRRS